MILYIRKMFISEHCSIDFSSSQATMELFPTSWNEMNEENCVTDSFLSYYTIKFSSSYFIQRCYPKMFLPLFLENAQKIMQ